MFVKEEKQLLRERPKTLNIKHKHKKTVLVGNETVCLIDFTSSMTGNPEVKRKWYFWQGQGYT